MSFRPLKFYYSNLDQINETFSCEKYKFRIKLNVCPDLNLLNCTFIQIRILTFIENSAFP